MVRNGTRIVALEVRPSCGLTVSCKACGRVEHFEVRDIDEQMLTRSELEQLAGLMDGTSPAYAVPPGEGSLIGACEACGARPISIEIVTTASPPSER